MPDNSFIAYVAPSDLHDGRINKVTPLGDTVTVEVAGESGRSISLVFRGVTDVQAVEPVGMILYALSEMRTTPPLRRFVFINWDEESSARLEILAEGLQVED